MMVKVNSEIKGSDSFPLHAILNVPHQKMEQRILKLQLFPSQA
jgi:hypothetical protein